METAARYHGRPSASHDDFVRMALCACMAVWIRGRCVCLLLSTRAACVLFVLL